MPEDAKQVSLVVGLEAVAGKASFDDIRVIAWKPPAVRSPPATGTMYKGHDLPRLRGAMVSPDVDEAGLRVLGQQWNANLIRWQLVRREKFQNPLDLVAYDRWLQSALKQLDAALPLCGKYGLRVVVDLHSPPGGHRLSGGYAGSDHGLFTDAACQRKFVEVWQHMARRYKDAKAIWGYDLANEPVEAVAGEDLADGTRQETETKLKHDSKSRLCQGLDCGSHARRQRRDRPLCASSREFPGLGRVDRTPKRSERTAAPCATPVPRSNRLLLFGSLVGVASLIADLCIAQRLVRLHAVFPLSRPPPRAAAERDERLDGLKEAGKAVALVRPGADWAAVFAKSGSNQSRSLIVALSLSRPAAREHSTASQERNQSHRMSRP